MEVTIRFSPLAAIGFALWLVVLALLAYITWGVLAIDRAERAFQVMAAVTAAWIVLGAAIGWARRRKSKQ